MQAAVKKLLRNCPDTVDTLSIFRNNAYGMKWNIEIYCAKIKERADTAEQQDKMLFYIETG